MTTFANSKDDVLNPVLDATTVNVSVALVPPNYTTAALPASPTESTIVYDTTANKLKFWNGSAYETITSA